MWNNRKIKLYRNVFALSILLAFFYISNSLAESASLKISISSDKSQYAAGDTAWLTLTIENYSNQDYYDLDIRHILPLGLEYVPDEYGYSYFEIIPANSTQIRTVGVKGPSADVSVSITSDKKAYKFGEIAKLSLTVKNNTNATLYDVELNHRLPNDLEYVELKEDGYIFFESLPALGSITRTFLVHSTYPEVLVTIDADKPNYQPGETAKLRVVVKNRSNKILKDVDIQHFLPDGMVYAIDHEQNQFQFITVEPGNSIESDVYVTYLDSELPNTGDLSNLWIILFLSSSFLLVILKYSYGGKAHV